MKVGVFDSGIGGLTVAKSLLEHKLFEEIIYFGDTARVPYGVKDKNTIIRYSLEALEFFKNFEIDLFIAACNTVSSHALDELRANCDFGVVGVIEPGVLALEKKIKDKNANILVIGTKATISGGLYESYLRRLGYKNITSIATGLFVPVVEEGIRKGEILDALFEHYFGKLKQTKKIDGVILGCTHFPLIADEISKYLDGAVAIHSGEAIVEYLEDAHKVDENFTKTKTSFFASENPNGLKKVAKDWLGDLISNE